MTKKHPDLGIRNWEIASASIWCKADAFGAFVFTSTDCIGSMDILAFSQQEADETLFNSRDW